LKFEVNIGHYIAAFGGGGGCFNSSQVLKEHVAVALYHQQVSHQPKEAHSLL
jgi:hypothetical protein